MLNIKSQGSQINQIKEYAELYRPDLINIPDSFQYCICYTSSDTNGLIGYATNDGIILYDCQMAISNPYYLIEFDNWLHKGIFNRLCQWIEKTYPYENININYLNQLNIEASKYLNDNYNFVYEVKSSTNSYNELESIPML